MKQFFCGVMVGLLVFARLVLTLMCKVLLSITMLMINIDYAEGSIVLSNTPIGVLRWHHLLAGALAAYLLAEIVESVADEIRGVKRVSPMGGAIGGVLATVGWSGWCYFLTRCRLEGAEITLPYDDILPILGLFIIFLSTAWDFKPRQWEQCDTEKTPAGDKTGDK